MVCTLCGGKGTIDLTLNKSRDHAVIECVPCITCGYEAHVNKNNDFFPQEEVTIDCLLEVTARFFKAGEKVFEIIEDEYSFTSYGDLLNDKYASYWELCSAKDLDKKGDILLAPDDEYYLILTDFVAFSFKPIFSGDFADGCGNFLHWNDIPLEDYLKGYEDAFVEYANEERNTCNESRKSNNRVCEHTLPDETNLIKFVLALKGNTICHPSGPWGPAEYDNEIEIVGKVDMSKLYKSLCF